MGYSTLLLQFQQFMSSRRVGVIFKKGSISIFDQLLFSGSNFVMSLLLGRWMGAEEYGAFSVAMAIFLLASGQYQSFVLEPMSVYGSKELDQDPPGYHGFILLIHFLLTLLLSVILISVTFLWQNDAGAAIRVMALVLPLSLLYWLTRWYFYMRLQPHKALTTTILYSLLLLIGIFFINRHQTLTTNQAFLVIGIASLIPSLVVFAFLPKTLRRAQSVFRVLVRDHWDYGKWVASASIFAWMTGQVYTVLVALHLDLPSVAGLRAVQNFALPLEHVSIALGLMLIPWGARIYASGRNKRILSRLHWINLLIILLGSAYIGLLLIFGRNILDFVYQGKYTNYGWLLPFLIGVPVVFSLSKGAQIGARIIQKPQLLLYAYITSSIVTIILGSYLLNRLGLVGAAIGSLLAVSTYSLTLNLLYTRETKKNLHES